MTLIKPDLNAPVFQLPTFAKEKQRVAAGKCPFCDTKVKAEDFRDEPSKQEYTLSGLCQKCQDETFGVAAPHDTN